MTPKTGSDQTPHVTQRCFVAVAVSAWSMNPSLPRQEMTMRFNSSAWAVVTPLPVRSMPMPRRNSRMCQPSPVPHMTSAHPGSSEGSAQ